jgi:hypothetical protein
MAATRRARGLGGHGGARVEGAKVRPCPYGRDARVLGCTRVSSVARTGARSRARTRRERDAALDTARRRRTAQKPNANGKRGTRRAARASTRAAAPAEISDPAWLDGRHHQRRRGGAVAFRLGSKAAAHRGEVSGILTWVASSRCAGVGDGARRCDEEGGGAGRGRRAARRQGSRAGRGRRRAWLPRVRLLLAGSSGVAAAAQVRLRKAALLLAPPPPLLPPLLRLRVGEQGIGFPRAARVGEIQRRRRRLLIAAGARGYVDGADAPGGRGGASRRPP